MWDEHLSTLSPDVAAMKRWRSGYWVNWFTALNPSDDSEFGNGGDILVAEIEEDVDEGFNWIAEVDVSEPDDDNHMWSVVSSPPFTDDARRGRPAVQDHQTQGGLSKTKPSSGAYAGDGSHIHALGRPTLLDSTAASGSDVADYASQNLPGVMNIACDKFELFLGLTLESQVRRWSMPSHP